MSTAAANAAHRPPAIDVAVAVAIAVTVAVAATTSVTVTCHCVGIEMSETLPWNSSVSMLNVQSPLPSGACEK